jgi:hypothetical protein
MTELKDLRKPQPTQVSFLSLKVGQAYEDNSGNFCIKTSNSFDGGDNCIYFDDCADEWRSELENASEEVLPLDIEINILP